MVFSKSCEYGIRATIFLASESSEEGDRYHSIKDLSDELDISYHFLTKTLQKLTGCGYLESYRGPRGGVRLAVPPEELSIKEIVLAIDGPEIFEDCVLGLPGCGEEKPCPMHDRWAEVRARLRDQLEGYSLAQLAEGVRTDELRLRSCLDVSANAH